jgi:endonuclease III related protein
MTDDRCVARLSDLLRDTYRALHVHYGPQTHWWPIFSDQPRLEILLGALLVQQTRWERVELAIRQLRDALGPAFSLEGIAAAHAEQLVEPIRPVAYYTVKARRLPELCAFFAARGGIVRALEGDLAARRAELLALPGVGRETADTILLYAAERPSFVIDAYTRRFFARLGCLPPDVERAPYDALRGMFQQALRAEDYAHYPHLGGELARLYADYHALIVEHGVRHCTSRSPRCDASGAQRIYTAEAGRVWRCPPCGGCPLREGCAFRQFPSLACAAGRGEAGGG